MMEEIKLFVSSDCKFCREVENELIKKKIKFQKIDIDSNLEEAFKAGVCKIREETEDVKCRVPAVKIGDELLVGGEKILERLR